MIKRTLCFSHPAYLSLRNGQLVVKLDPHDDEPERQASVPTVEVTISGQRSPLMVAATQTTASLARCFSGENRRISYPEM